MLETAAGAAAAAGGDVRRGKQGALEGGAEGGPSLCRCHWERSWWRYLSFSSQNVSLQGAARGGILPKMRRRSSRQVLFNLKLKNHLHFARWAAGALFILLGGYLRTQSLMWHLEKISHVLRLKSIFCE